MKALFCAVGTAGMEPSNSALRRELQIIGNRHSSKYLHVNVRSSTICSSQKVETTLPTNEWMVTKCGIFFLWDIIQL